MTNRRRMDRRAGVSALEVLVVLAIAVVIISMSVTGIMLRVDQSARNNFAESIREGNVRSMKRAFNNRDVGVSLIDMNGLIFEEWTPPDAKTLRIGFSYLAYAARWNQEDAAKLLIAQGAKVDGNGWADEYQPVFWAAYHGNESLFDMLIEAGADVNSLLRRKTALGHAAGTYEEAAEFLKARGAVEADDEN